MALTGPAVTPASDPAQMACVPLYRKLVSRFGRDHEWSLPTNHRGVADVDPLLAAVDDVLGSRLRGDTRALNRLIGYGYVQVKQSEDGRTLYYRLAPEEPEPDTRSWVEIEQARIDAEVARERAIMEREADDRERIARTLLEPQEAAERFALVRALQHPDVQAAIGRLIDERVQAALAQRESVAA